MSAPRKNPAARTDDDDEFEPTVVSQISSISALNKAGAPTINEMMDEKTQIGPMPACPRSGTTGAWTTPSGNAGHQGASPATGDAARSDAPTDDPNSTADHVPSASTRPVDGRDHSSF